MILPLVVQQLRRDRVTLPIWIAGTALLLTVSAASVVTEYGDAQGRAQILAVALATPALLALRGIPNGDSLGSAVHFQSFAFLAVTIGLMNVFLATRHGRADEVTGRREPVLASPISRWAPLGATLIVGVIANGGFAALAVAGYTSAGLDLGGAALSAGALGLTGLAFLGLTAVAGQLVATSRAANGIGVALVLGSYGLRAAGDALGRAHIRDLSLAPAWPSSLSPIGWGQQTLAFTDDRAWPLAALAALAVGGSALAVAVQARRELGASAVGERRGRPRARATLAAPIGLAWRLQWPTVVAWVAGTGLLGLVLGQLVTAIGDSGLDNPRLQEVLQSLGGNADDIASTLLSAVMNIVGAIAAAAGVQAVLRMREEEAAGRLETVLATPRSRVGWLAAFSLVAAATVLLVLLAAGLAGAAGFAVLGRPDPAWLALGSAIVQAPAALALAGVAVLLVGAVPRAAVALSWGVFGVLVVIGLFGDLLQLPDGAERISPLTSVPTLPAEDWGPTVVVSLVVAALGAVGAVAIRRRDVSS